MSTSATGKPSSAKPTSALRYTAGAPEVLPWWLLRRLCVSHEVSIGSRVLVVGCGDGSVLQQLEWLGIDAVGTDESAENVAAARRAVPASEVVQFGGREPLAFESGRFDAVFVRPQAIAQQNLLSAGSLESTAQLLSCLRPAGWCVFLSRVSSGSDGDRPASGEQASDDHSEACFQRHLEPFPGTFRSQPVSFGFPWDRLLPGRSRAPFLTAALQTPSRALSRDEWLQHARRTAESAAGSCCSVGAEETSLEWPRRAA